MKSLALAPFSSARSRVAVGLIVLFLQRLPAWRAAWETGTAVRLPAGLLLRASALVGALGSLHTLAGATAYVQSPANPVTGTVGSRVDVAFTYNGTPSAPARWQVSGSLPPGLAFSPAASGGVIRADLVTISGVPTQAGTFSVFVQGFNADGLTNGLLQEIRFVISAATSGSAPTIATPPQGQSVLAGASVTFTVQATGSPAPAYRWTKDGVAVVGATAASLTLTNVQPTDAGDYAVIVSNAAGSVTSPTATLSVSAPPAGGGSLAVERQPASQQVAAGGTVAFNVTAPAASRYQWRRNGVPVPGASRATLVLASVSPAQAGDYTVVMEGGGRIATSEAAGLTVTPGPDAGRLVNLSILTTLSRTESFFTLGTVIGGADTAGTKPLLIRAAGPALTQLGVTGELGDPKLDVFSGPVVTSSNDDWGGSAALISAFGQVGAFPFAAANSKDAAAFNPQASTGAYTIQVSGVGGATGSVIAELYDATADGAVTAATPRLVNVSVLKQIPTGGSLTAGFVIGGGAGAAKTVLIRAIGPTLAAAPFNVSGAMPDPKLELFRAQTVVAANDDWSGDAQLTEVGGRVGAFALGDPGSRDAILLVTLAPGSYTAQVSGVTGGLVLVEVYEVP